MMTPNRRALARDIAGAIMGILCFAFMCFMMWYASTGWRKFQPPGLVDSVIEECAPPACATKNYVVRYTDGTSDGCRAAKGRVRVKCLDAGWRP